MYQSERYSFWAKAMRPSPDSGVKVLVVPTNEELAIARETAALVK